MDLRGSGGLASLSAIVVWVGFAIFPLSSDAAVTIGATGGEVDMAGYCESNSALVQWKSDPAGPSYDVPAGGGVLTAWSIEAYNAAASLKLKVFRDTGEGIQSFLVVGRSDLRKLTPNSRNTFPVSPGIRVAAGDKLGLQTPPIVISGSESRCTMSAPIGSSIFSGHGDTSPGSSQLLDALGSSFTRLNVAATMEPDLDGDGLGDESQDPCPTVAGTVCPSPKPVEPAADVTSPRLKNLFIRPTAFRVAGKRSARSSASTGATFGYTLSEAASVSFTIERLSRGRRVKRKCVKPKRSNRRSKPCTRAKPLGSFTRQSSAGTNRKRFSGKIGRKPLKPGRYRATLEAVDASNNASLPRRLGFAVLSPTKDKRP
jgi:hypothetical protein